MNKPKWNLHKLIDLFYEINGWLKLWLNEEIIEKYSIFIYENMSEEHRYYHNMWHIFDLIIEKNNVNNLAAIYHDIVYFQIYQKLNEKLYDLLKDYIKIDKVDIYLNIDEKELKNNKRLNIILDIFWFKNSDKLNIFWWLNEILSAFVVYKHVWEKLKINDFIELITMIEATIPFRANYVKNTEEKLTKIIDKYNINFNIEKIIRNSIIIANNDVSSFYEEELWDFLEWTWKLLPENNPSLRNRTVYKVSDYKNSIFKTYMFFKNIKFNYIINRYDNHPKDSEYEKMMLNIIKNILNTKYFLKFKLIPISILDSIASKTWWDTLMSYFMWELDEKTMRLEDYLVDKRKIDNSHEIDNIVLNWINLKKIIFDISKSPIVIYMYKNIWFEWMNILWDLAEEYLKWEINWVDFLKHIDKKLLKKLLNYIKKMLPTREDKIKILEKELKI